MKTTDIETITRLVLLLDAAGPALEKLALSERRRESGKPMRQTTEQHRAKAARDLVDDVALKYCIDLGDEAGSGLSVKPTPKGFAVFRNGAIASKATSLRSTALMTMTKMAKRFDGNHSIRKCMRCENDFESEGIHNRMCANCKQQA